MSPLMVNHAPSRMTTLSPKRAIQYGLCDGAYGAARGRAVRRGRAQSRGAASRRGVTMKPITLAIVCCALTALGPCAEAASVGVSMALFDDNFLTTVRTSMQQRAQEQKISIQFEDAQNDIGRQLNQIQNFLAQKVDAIIVNPVDTDATPKITRLAVRAGIPLVYVNRMPGDKQLPPRVSFWGSDEAQSGTLRMAEGCRLLHGKGEIVILIRE